MNMPKSFECVECNIEVDLTAVHDWYVVGARFNEDTGDSDPVCEPCMEKFWERMRDRVSAGKGE